MSTLSSTSYPMGESMGSLKLHILDFSALDTADTYTSGIPGIVGYWGVVTSGLSTITSGGSLQISESAGVLTINVNAGNPTLSSAAFKARIYVISKS